VVFAFIPRSVVHGITATNFKIVPDSKNVLIQILQILNLRGRSHLREDQR